MSGTGDDCANQTVETEIVVEGRRVKVRARRERALPPWTSTREVGRALRRVDGVDKVTGAARYTADVQLPGMLHARILRSPWAAATRLAFDAPALRRLPGVLAILTPGEVAGVRIGGAPVLTREPRFAGDEIAAIAAISEEALDAAFAAVRLEGTPLPHVLTAEDAMRPDAPALLPGGNVSAGSFGESKPGERDRYRRGDPAAGFARADRVLEREYTTEAVQHACMETHGAVASWDGDGLTVWESTQGVFFVRAALCKALGLPASRVRVLCPFMGGGFGSKNSAEKHTVLAALLARQTGRPVRLVLPREDDFVSGFYRPGSTQRLRIALSKSGRIEAIALDALNPVGARKHGDFFGNCAGPAQDFYACPDVETSNRAIFTNAGPPAAFRAPGHVQGSWGLEQILDEACAELGLDPVAVRLANLPAADPTTGLPFSSDGLAECIRRGARAIGWRKHRALPAGRGRRRRGLGMAITSWGAGGGPPASAQVAIHEDGSVVVSIGACDLGTGTRTVMTQIAAEELGIDPGRIAVAHADTRLTPYCLPSFGSLTVASTGPAVRLAASDALRQLLELAGGILGKPAAELAVSRGRIGPRSGRGRSIAFDAAARGIPARLIVGTAERGPNPPGVALASFAAHFAEVEVDCELGTVRVLRFVAAHDSGRILNPATWTSQIHGGILQGLGYALLEQRVVDPASGRQLNARLLDYKIPTHADAPGSIEVIDVRVPYPGNNINAKGTGEPPIIPVAPAIANAIFAATGARVRSAPITPARLLAALAGRS